MLPASAYGDKGLKNHAAVYLRFNSRPTGTDLRACNLGIELSGVGESRGGLNPPMPAISIVQSERVAECKDATQASAMKFRLNPTLAGHYETILPCRFKSCRAHQFDGISMNDYAQLGAKLVDMRTISPVSHIGAS